MHRFHSFLGFIALALLLSNCTDKITTEDNLKSKKRYKAIFTLQEKEIPIIFHLDTVPSNPYGFRTIFIDGPQKNQKEVVQIKQDSITVQLDYSSTVYLKGILKDNRIEGVFQDQKKNTAETIPFKAVQTNEPRFTKPLQYNAHNTTGTWVFTFDTDKTSPNLSLYYKLHQIKIFQKEYKLTAYAYYQQGFEGIQTPNGFTLSSFSSEQPVLLEAHFINASEIEGQIYTYSEVTTFKATKKSKAEATKDEGSSIFTTLLRVLKVYSEYPT